MHNIFLDHLISQLEDRLCGSSNKMKAEALLPHHIQSLTEKDVQDIKEGYRQFINLRDLDVEIEHWKFKKFNSDHVSLEECVSYTKGMFPNLHVIFSGAPHLACLCCIS